MTARIRWAAARFIGIPLFIGLAASNRGMGTAEVFLGDGVRASVLKNESLDGRTRQKNRDMIAALVEKMSADPDRHVRWAALGTLVSYGKDAKPELPAIARMIRQEIRAGRFRSEEATAAHFATFGGAGVWVLESWIADPETGRDLRLWAAHCLGLVGSQGPMAVSEAKTAVRFLVQVLAESDETLKQRAIYALSKMGRNAKEALPGLTDYMTKAKGFTVADAAAAICRIEPDNRLGIERLRSQVSERDAELRRLAISYISELPPRREFALALVNALTSDDCDTRRAAILALHSQYLPSMEDVIPHIRKRLSDRDDGVREAARFALEAAERDRKLGPVRK